MQLDQFAAGKKTDIKSPDILWIFNDQTFCGRSKRLTWKFPKIIKFLKKSSDYFQIAEKSSIDSVATELK